MLKDTEKKEKIGAIRTRKLLSDALIRIMETTSFESISVKTICEESLIPRATFYNYFEDKYVLLKYCIQVVQEASEPTKISSLSREDHLIKLINNVIDYILKNKKIFQNISRTNSNGVVFFEIQKYLAADITDKLNEIENRNTTIPPEVIAIYYSSAIVFTAKWWLETESPFTRKDLVRYMELLIDQKILFGN